MIKVLRAVGERLHRLAEGSQLLVVTHSPQVAARYVRDVARAIRSDLVPGAIAWFGTEPLQFRTTASGLQYRVLKEGFQVFTQPLAGLQFYTETKTVQINP